VGIISSFQIVGRHAHRDAGPRRAICAKTSSNVPPKRRLAFSFQPQGRNALQQDFDHRILSAEFINLVLQSCDVPLEPVPLPICNSVIGCQPWPPGMPATDLSRRPLLSLMALKRAFQFFPTSSVSSRSVACDLANSWAFNRCFQGCLTFMPPPWIAPSRASKSLPAGLVLLGVPRE